MTMTALWGRVKDRTRLATAGGTWARAVSQSVQHNLRWFFLDGVLFSVQDGTTATYLSLFILALGATSGQIGLMAALVNLSAMLMLLPGAMLAERFGKRKLIVMLFGAGTTRFMILLIALTPFLLRGQAAIYLIIIFKVIADGSSSLSLPAWTSLAGDIVPLAWRGHYFGSKNLYMAIGGIAATFLIGNLIARSGSIEGYQLAFGIAFIFGLAATFCYSHVTESPVPANAVKPPSYSPKSLIQTLKDDRNFLNFAAFGMIWNLAIGVIGPFFNIYIIEGLKGNASDVGLFAIAGSVAGLPAMHFFGRLSDRWGPRKVMFLTGSMIPLIPIVWLLARVPLHGILLNIPAGIVWGGFNLAAFNFLLAIAPTDKRARYTALYQISVATSAAAGAALGGVIISRFGYVPVFIISGIGRFLGFFFFARFVHQKGEAG